MYSEFNIIVVGCGGIGGNFIKELGRFLYKNSMKERCRILLVDGDLVEASNICRQPFLAEDIKRKKVEVMSEILQQAFQVKTEYYTEYLEDVEDLMKFVQKGSLTVLVGAVDNHHCRRIMHEFFTNLDSCFYVDAANEYSAGEVVAGMRIAGEVLYHDRAYYFPEILTEDSKFKGEESCLQVNETSPQHIVTNLFAAYLLLMNVISVLTEVEWSGGVYFFDAFKGFSQLRESESIWKEIS